MIRLFSSDSATFSADFQTILNRSKEQSDSVDTAVRQILADVKSRGDAALLEQIAKFDGWTPTDASELVIKPEQMEEGYLQTPKELRDALHLSFDRISAYHEKLKPKSWIDFEADGITLGQKVSPVERAGLYIPGGKAVYPSSVLMNAAAAIVAGVEEIVLCSPAIKNEINSSLLAAMHICGIKKAFKVGGASAIAAMAYGTETISKVDVITGPGNIFVATAKKLVFGEVNIDMIAGPSEIGIIADGSANAEFIALDLLSQAEHDEMAASILITTDFALAEKVSERLEYHINALPRREVMRASIDNNGAIVVCESLNEACKLMNRIAPEHLEIMTVSPYELLPKIKHAGAIFLGENTPEPIGDYIAGPNHTLPTGGSARFSSPLSTEHFMKKSSIIGFSKEGIERLGPPCALVANSEGFFAHEASVLARLK